MTRICIVRHGETNWNAEGRIQGSTDIHLNKNGIMQAQKCRDALKNSKWDVLVTSPLTRAKQTANIINEALRMDIVEMPEFKERSFGEAEGMTLGERRTAFPDGLYPNQEDSGEFSNRIGKGINLLHEKYQDQKILLVAHGAVIHRILADFSDGDFSSKDIKLSNACFNHMHFLENKWNITDFNNIDHL